MATGEDDRQLAGGAARRRRCLLGEVERVGQCPETASEVPTIACMNCSSRAGASYSPSKNDFRVRLTSFCGRPVRSASVRSPQKGTVVRSSFQGFRRCSSGSPYRGRPRSRGCCDRVPRPLAVTLQEPESDEGVGKSGTARGAKPRSCVRLALVVAPLASRVKSSSSTAERSTFEGQNPEPICKFRDGSSCSAITSSDHLWL